MKKLIVPIIASLCISSIYAQEDFDISDLPDVNEIEATETKTVQAQPTTRYASQQGTYNSIKIDGENNQVQTSNDEQIPWIRNGWRLGLHIGPTVFAGDIMGEKNTDALSDMQLQAGFSLEKRLCAPIDLRLGVSSGKLKGTQEKYHSGAIADVYFDNHYFDFDVDLKLDLVKMFNENTPFSIYLTGGIGYCSFNADAKRISTDNEIAHVDGGSLMFPIGAGINFRVANNWNINLEGVMKLATGDDLDTREVNINDKALDDMYGVAKLGIIYTFGSKKDVVVKEVVRYIEPLEEEVVEQPVIAEEIEETAEPEQQVVAETAPTQAVAETPVVVAEETKPEPVKAPVKSTGTIIVPGLTYRIQILAKKEQGNKINEIQQKYGFIGKITTEVDKDGLTKYYIGSFQTFDGAKEYRDSLEKKGIQNAFIVPFKDNKRIDNQTARTLRGE